ncbi:MYCBP-associated protein [Tautogolabrus adspersus]
MDQMSGESPNNKLKPLIHPESKKPKTAEELNILGDDRPNQSDLQTLATHPQDANKLYIPKPPKGHRKSVLMACVGETQPDDGARKSVLGAQQVNLDPEPHPLDYTDHQGMVLPHSILGSLEDFRSYLESKGETELVKNIPESQRDPASEASGRPHTDAVKKDSMTPSGFRSIQRNALQHWKTHMRQRRQQQDFLSDLLDRPVEYLLMNQANHFRETQEQRELLNHVMPLVHSGYGYRVGSEFWSLPPRYGDEMSGIAATLTQTEQGRQEPVTHVGQPSSIRQESGIMCDETLRPASRTWDQSAYLQHQCQELGEVLKEMDIKKPDISGLEVIGSCKPFTHVTVCRSPSLEKEEEETKKMKEDLDPLAQYIDVHSDILLVPALRFCGQLACWTGNTIKSQGEVGISATIMFETLTGERASSHLDLHNEGSTAIFYSWQQLPVRHSFPNLRSQTKGTHFYFNCSSGVILPGGIQRVEFVFKLMEPGIKTELWRLNTHPVLLGGASMQLTLRGVALYRDTTADQRRFLETKLEKIVTVKMCRSIVYEMLQGVRTQERPSSPAELYFTEEQRFLVKNPKLQFLDETVDDLKKLWQEVNPGHTWDLSVDTLRQAVLISDQESAQEQNLTQLNSLHLLQLWRKLLDVMDDEARCLQKLLCLPQRDTWSYKKEESLTSDAEMVNKKDETSDKKEGAAKEDRSGMRSRFKDDNKGESKAASTEKLVECPSCGQDSKKKGRRRDEATAKRSRGKQEKESPSLTDGQIESAGQQPPEDDEQNEGPEMTEIYTRLLHRKVYALIEDLVDNLCDLMDELDKRNEH